MIDGKTGIVCNDTDIVCNDRWQDCPTDNPEIPPHHNLIQPPSSVYCQGRGYPRAASAFCQIFRRHCFLRLYTTQKLCRLSSIVSNTRPVTMHCLCGLRGRVRQSHVCLCVRVYVCVCVHYQNDLGGHWRQRMTCPFFFLFIFLFLFLFFFFFFFFRARETLLDTLFRLSVVLDTM